jgi:hypothetical protein
MLDINMSIYLIALIEGFCYKEKMEDKKMFATRINKDLLKRLKILSVHNERPINSLLEEAIQDVLTKYEKKTKKKP